MGIKHFYIWFRDNFKNSLKVVKGKIGENVDEDIDVFALDLNGIFHNCAQRVYKYGNHERKLKTHFDKQMSKYPNATLKLQLKLFQEICDTIEECRAMVNPRKKLLLCIDGVAGLGKMSQQRQRRFLSARSRAQKKELDDACPFDQNSITPGTKFMHNLSKYIDWYIRMMVTHNEDWKKIEVFFSNEKVPGEGEHKIVEYIRNNSPYDTYCIYGSDADLFMLSLATGHDKLWILRENTYDKFNRSGLHYFIDISKFREKLLDKHLGWCTDVKFNKRKAIDDFVFICFLVGNDFVPNIPTMSILEGGIDNMIQIYRNVCSVHGHLTHTIKNYITFRKTPLQEFFKELAILEKPGLEEKWESRESYFPDILLNSHMTSRENGSGSLDFPSYMKTFYKEKFPDPKTTLRNICDNYLMGLKWVINYYKFGMPNWEWFYPYHYGPFFSTLSENIEKFKNENFKTKGNPISQFEQLLIVISPQSSELLPPPLDKLLGSTESPLSKCNRLDFEVDVSGKRREWEGIVKVPVVDLELFLSNYKSREEDISTTDIRRNKIFKPVNYSISGDEYDFKSFYGEIPGCKTKISKLE